MLTKEIRAAIVCPSCKRPLTQHNGLHCDRCGRTYPVIEGVPHLLVRHDPDAKPHDRCRTFEYKSGVRNSRIFKALKYIFGADFIPYNPLLAHHDIFLGLIDKGGFVLNCGSGATRLAPGIVNLDKEPFPHVDIVGDGCLLPFADDSCDAVISDAVIEHVKRPQEYVSQIKRVLKPRGAVFMVAPFIHPFHGYPSDYQRYSIEGIRALFEDFDEIECGVYRGPGVAFVNFVSDYLAGLFCLKPEGRLLAKSFFTLLLFPLKFLDIFLNRRSDAFILAHCVYFIGRINTK